MTRTKDLGVTTRIVRDVVASRMKSAESSKVHYEKDLKTSRAKLANISC